MIYLTISEEDKQSIANSLFKIFLKLKQQRKELPYGG
jgi:hypothetical protein